LENGNHAVHPNEDVKERGDRLMDLVAQEKTV